MVGRVFQYELSNGKSTVMEGSVISLWIVREWREFTFPAESFARKLIVNVSSANKASHMPWSNSSETPLSKTILIPLTSYHKESKLVSLAVAWISGLIFQYELSNGKLITKSGFRISLWMILVLSEFTLPAESFA